MLLTIQDMTIMVSLSSLTMRWAEETISINLSLLGLFINAQRVILTALSYFISRLQTQETEISAAWKLL